MGRKNNKIDPKTIAAIRDFCLTIGTKTEAAKRFGVSRSIVWYNTKDMTSRRPISQDAIKGEKWRPVVGYEKYYKVSNHGRIRSGFTGLIMGMGVSNWYPNVSVCKDGTKKNVCVHQLVAKAFIPNPQNKPCVNHIDGNKRNNHVSNLEWATFKENEQHSYRKLGKIGTKENLKNFSKEWGKPLVVGGVNLCGKVQKMLYKKLINGLKSNEYKKLNIDRGAILDVVKKLKRGGIKISRTPIKEINPKIGRGVKCFFYKISA